MRQKRYRIEDASTLPPGFVSAQAVSRRASVGSKHLLPRRDRDVRPGERVEPFGEIERLAVELHAMRDAIAATTREMADLRSSPSGADGMHRAAQELDAVTSATERAATTILGAVEEIETAAHLLRARQGAALEGNDPVDEILKRVLVLYEACNFQDIARQRIRKVLQTLRSVDDKLDRLIAAWDLPRPSSPDLDLPAIASGFVGQLGGPKLPGDEGHVSQADVDAYFG